MAETGLASITPSSVLGVTGDIAGGHSCRCPGLLSRIEVAESSPSLTLALPTDADPVPDAESVHSTWRKKRSNVQTFNVLTF
jgi:hypothetical protein